MAGILQHLRSSTLDKRPSPGSMVDGQVAINYASGSPGMFFKDSNGSLVKVGPVHVGSGAPNASPASGGTAGNSIGEQWLDTSGGTYVFKVWDGSAWRSEAGEFVNVTGDTMTGTLTIGSGATIAFEGSTDDGFETTLTVVDPTADRTITFPNISGTVVTTGDTGSVTSTMIADGTIVNADVSPSAAIAGTKISPDFGSQTVATTGVFSHALGTAGAPTVTFSGDPNTGIYSPGADQVAVATGGVQRINIEADGDINIDGGGVFYDATNNRLGIGTTSPGAALDVVTGADGILGRFQGADSDTFEISGESGLIALDTRNTTNGLDFQIQGLSKMRLDASGRLLVGTSSAYTIGASSGWAFQAATAGIAAIRPSNDINPCVFTLAKTRSTSLGSYAIVQNNDNIGEINFAADDGADYATVAALIRCQVDGTPGASDMPGRLVFSTTTDGASSPTTRMTIDSSGRVLVGTTSARGVGGTTSGQVEIEGGAEARHTVVRNSNDTGAPVIALGKSRGTSAGATTIVQAGDTCGLIFFAGADGTDIESRCAQIEGVVDGTPGANDMPGRLVFSTTPDGSATPTERARITNAGEVWIAGTTDQGAYNLQVNGTGVWGAGAYVNGSDERLKEDIQPLADASEVLRKLRPVSFKYKADYSRDQNIQPGFIAQELQEAMAGQVYLDGIVQQGPEYLNVAYQGLIPVLTKALQEALDKIASLEARIATLEAT